MSAYRVSRRHFLLQAAVIASSLPLLGRMASASAAGLPRLPPGNAQAKALGYVEDEGKSTNPAHKHGSACSNCQFFTKATGACALFAGFSVNADGWCTAWAKKAG